MSTEQAYPAPPFDAELAPVLAEITSVIPSTVSLRTRSVQFTGHNGIMAFRDHRVQELLCWE
jgi:hypothetical protein